MPVASTERARVENKTFLQEVWQGLSTGQKSLPCKYFYDERGSILFEAICATDDYYVTRTEMGIFSDNAKVMAEYVGAGSHIIEPGAGAVKKIKLLLETLKEPASYIPLDISAEFLLAASEQLAALFPTLRIDAREVDFMDRGALARCLRRADNAKQVVFFPGSTIGNFAPAAAQEFLESIANALRRGDGLLIGVDLLKPVAILEAAYNDSDGVTASFNRNLLQRINAELDGDIVIEHFAHEAIFNPAESRIEMHLRSLRSQKISVAGRTFQFAANETIHTENSYKYAVADFTAMAERAGFFAEALWLDESSFFSVHYMAVK